MCIFLQSKMWARALFCNLSLTRFIEINLDFIVHEDMLKCQYFEVYFEVFVTPKTCLSTLMSVITNKCAARPFSSPQNFIFNDLKLSRGTKCMRKFVWNDAQKNIEMIWNVCFRVDYPLYCPGKGLCCTHGSTLNHMQIHPRHIYSCLCFHQSPEHGLTGLKWRLLFYMVLQ